MKSAVQGRAKSHLPARRSTVRDKGPATKRAIDGLVILVCLLLSTTAFADGDDKAAGDNYTVPVGVLGQFSINKQLAVSTSWVLGM
jgi:hypothetical protein